MSRLKRILILLAVLLAVFVILDFGYFWANFKFLETSHKKFSSQAITTAVPAKSMQANWLSIPSLDISAPIVYADQPNEHSFQAALINGVGHYPGTAAPGQYGNCYIFGHSSDFIWSKGHYKTVFAVLPKIQIGDSIYISDAAGNAFTYLVTDSREVASNDTLVLAQDTSKKILTLQTSYPVGTALARWVVVAEIKN